MKAGPDPSADQASQRDLAAELRDREAEAQDDSAVDSEVELQLDGVRARGQSTTDRARAAGLRAEAARGRARAGAERRRLAEGRAEFDARRDLEGRDRDSAADRRDAAAELRDRAAEAIPGSSVDSERARMAASDRRHAAGDRAFAASARAATATDREQAITDRRSDAESRLAEAVSRDEEADLRDQAADAADEIAAQADRRLELRAAGDRRHWATSRAAAGRDRRGSAEDRGQAARDRADSGIDELTGASRRGFGLAAIAREMDRAKRTGDELVVAYVDVDGLKSENDRKGHAAGDSLLVAVAGALRARLRSYDLVIRVGGDEFVCLLPGIAVEVARERMAAASDELAVLQPGASFTFGLAELRGGESVDELVNRADADVLRTRGRR